MAGCSDTDDQEARDGDGSLDATGEHLAETIGDASGEACKSQSSFEGLCSVGRIKSFGESGGDDNTILRVEDWRHNTGDGGRRPKGDGGRPWNGRASPGLVVLRKTGAAAVCNNVVCTGESGCSGNADREDRNGEGSLDTIDATGERCAETVGDAGGEACTSQRCCRVTSAASS